MVAYAYAARYPDKTEKLVVMDAPVPGIPPWDDIVRNPLLWHFSFGCPDAERIGQPPWSDTGVSFRHYVASRGRHDSPISSRSDPRSPADPDDAIVGEEIQERYGGPAER